MPDTSWETSADWYDNIIGADGSELYRRVVVPGAMRLLKPAPHEHILDLGCGQGVFSRALSAAATTVTGVDSAPSLLAKARTYQKTNPVRYELRDAANLDGLGPFDAISAILSIQNMEHPPEVCLAAKRALKPGGRMLWILNHPCFRIPKHTSWDWDTKNATQFRRIDSYATPLRIPILMHPGQANSEQTWSYHLSLTDLMGDAFAAGFHLTALDEWTSHKISEPGPRAHAENQARMEFPLFLALLWGTPPLALPNNPLLSAGNPTNSPSDKSHLSTTLNHHEKRP